MRLLEVLIIENRAGRERERDRAQRKMPGVSRRAQQVYKQGVLAVFLARVILVRSRFDVLIIALLGSASRQPMPGVIAR